MPAQPSLAGATEADRASPDWCFAPAGRQGGAQLCDRFPASSTPGALSRNTPLGPRTQLSSNPPAIPSRDTKPTRVPLARQRPDHPSGPSISRLGSSPPSRPDPRQRDVICRDPSIPRRRHLLDPPSRGGPIAVHTRARLTTLHVMTPDTTRSVDHSHTRHGSSDLGVLVGLWEEARFPRLPCDAPNELRDLTEDVDNPKRVHVIHKASRRHNFQSLVQK